jgi:hypothetical protein
MKPNQIGDAAERLFQRAMAAQAAGQLADAERLGVVVGAPPGAACTCEAAASLDALRVRPAPLAAEARIQSNRLPPLSHPLPCNNGR